MGEPLPPERIHPAAGKSGLAKGSTDTWPIYRYGWAPPHLKTRRQLRAMGLCPGGHRPVAEIRWQKPRPGRPIEQRVAYLYDSTLARPKRVPSPGQLAALAKCMAVRSTCPKCGQVKDYCISHALGCCNTCYELEQQRQEQAS
jgi:hypothetical protein